MSIKVPNISIVDWETGGLDPRINAVTEFAGITIHGETLEEICQYEAVLKPYNSELLYDPDALRITGISMEMINNGVDFKTFSKDFLNFWRKSNPNSHVKYRTIIAGHNINFDGAFFQQIFYHLGKKIEDSMACSQDFFGNQYPKLIDTLPLSMFRWAKEEVMVNHKLNTCCEKANIELVSAHRAMNDVKANADLLRQFIINLRAEGRTESVAELVEESKFNFRQQFKF